MCWILRKGCKSHKEVLERQCWSPSDSVTSSCFKNWQLMEKSVWNKRHICNIFLWTLCCKLCLLNCSSICVKTNGFWNFKQKWTVSILNFLKGFFLNLSIAMSGIRPFIPFKDNLISPKVSGKYSQGDSCYFLSSFLNDWMPFDLVVIINWPINRWICISLGGIFL